MSAITDEIQTIETHVNHCFDSNAPIDPHLIKRLQELRVERLKELVQTHEQRSAVMRGHANALTDKLVGLRSNGRPDVFEKITEGMQKFDEASIHWVISEMCPWEESDAYSIAAGILILIGEVND